MKKILYSIIVLLMLSATVFAQAPQSFKYQAVARDASGEVIADQKVSFQISILQSSESGTAVYTETHVDSTNQFGLVTLEIGTGTTTDDFTGIDWGNDAYFIQIEMDASGGTSYTLIGTSQLLSVPYALHAKTAANTFSGDYSDLINKPVIPDTLSDLVSDAGNESITNLADPINKQDAATKAYVDALEAQILELQIATGLKVKDIDGNIYKTVIIGNQEWMGENLKVITYNDGTAITLEEDNTAWGNLSTEAYCWYDNDSDSYSQTYGALYNWYTVSTGKLCPSGWHVPTDAEWKELEMHLGMSQSDADDFQDRGTNEGSKLAGNEILWSDGDLDNNSEFGTSGFTALPGGYRLDYGASYGIGNHAACWSSSEYSLANSLYRAISRERCDIQRRNANWVMGYSVRCIKDE